MWAVKRERAISPAAGIVILESCLERCLRYATTRVQFGKPIASFQAIQFKLARMRADIALLTAILHEVIAGLEAGRDMRTETAAGEGFAGDRLARRKLG